MSEIAATENAAPQLKQCSVSSKPEEAVVSAAAALLHKHCQAHGVDDSHGLKHAQEVLAHADRALAASERPLTRERSLAVRLAALLHDADDRKYFGKHDTLVHATRILSESGAAAFGEGVTAEVLFMIGVVSCSKNGNSCPEQARDEPELLWPRWADRLEAAGEIGLARTFMHNTRSGEPLSCETTPRPANEAEAWALATEARFAEYQRSGGHSDSMMDHFYDKLLQVSRPPPALVRNSYLEAEFEKRAAPLMAMCLAYGKTGEVPVAEFEATVKKFGLKH